MHSGSLLANKHTHMQKYLTNLHAWPGQDFLNQCRIWNQRVKNITFKYRSLTSWFTVICFHCTIWLIDSPGKLYAIMKPVHVISGFRVNMKCPICIKCLFFPLWLSVIYLNHHNAKIIQVKTHLMSENLTFIENTLKAGTVHFIIIVMPSL